MNMWRLSFASAVVLLLPALVAGQSETDVFHIAWGSTFYQVSSTELVPVLSVDPGAYNWSVEIGMEFAGPSGPVATAALHGSPFPSGRPLYKFEGDPYEFQYKTGFSTMDEMVQFLPPETYSFKWTTVSGSTLNEPLDLPAFEPLEPRKLINYDALQNIKPQQPVVIQWEPMSGLDGKDGFIEVEIIYTDEWSHFLWSSEDLVEEGFGLDPSTTSVEVPAGTFIGSPDGRYQILISFARIEYLVANDTNPEGLKGVATTTMTRATLKTKPEVPGHIYLPIGDWLYCEVAGWIFGCTMEWGYSNGLGWVFLGYTPGYIYQSNLGWLSPMGGSMANGIWFYSYTHGWIFTAENYGGWYLDPLGNWSNMLTP